MSTRGWYEYYVINPENKKMSRAMQFYKWGDAVPENALAEWRFFHRYILEKSEELPIILVDDMLREQFSVLYDRLPEYFTLGIFLFFLQRAKEESAPYRHARWKYRNMPLKQRPDYRLGFAIGKAEVLSGLPKYQCSDPYLESVLFFIETGHFVRPWKNYALRFSALEWLQYLTQLTLETDMGSIAGNFTVPFDINYIYRFFIWVDPANPLRIQKHSLELCNRHGDSLLAELHQNITNDMDEDELKYLLDMIDKIENSSVDLFSLEAARKDFALMPDIFWSKNSFEYPQLSNESPKSGDKILA